MDNLLIKKLRKKKTKIKKARKIKKENDLGNIEYKLRICNHDNHQRIEQLITQIKFRLNEGNGRAIYNIGYTDDGVPQGITYSVIYENLNLFHNMLTRAGGELISLKMFQGVEGFCANIFITGKDDIIEQKFLDDFYCLNI